MRILWRSVFAAGVILGSATGAEALVPTSTQYSSCAELLSKYPNGVAKSKTAANKATNGGFARPSVSSALYSVNGSRLDRDKDGVMCEQSN